MKNKKIKILVCYHKRDKLYSNEILTPIHVGRNVALDPSKDGILNKNDLHWLQKI